MKMKIHWIQRENSRNLWMKKQNQVCFPFELNGRIFASSYRHEIFNFRLKVFFLFGFSCLYTVCTDYCIAYLRWGFKECLEALILSFILFPFFMSYENFRKTWGKLWILISTKWNSGVRILKHQQKKKSSKSKA